jgi:Glycosyltransferase sugar-binding region containing DXD motif
MSRSETVRFFWHGSPLGPYQLMGMRSFVEWGYSVELFTYDPTIAVPEWIVRRDASEIWPTDHILRYRNDSSRGGFALHANLFRYAMLHRLGGWWIDHDVILLRHELPAQDIFFSLETIDPLSATNSVLKFPAGHPAMSDCVARCLAAGETPLYGETATVLFTEIAAKYRLTSSDRSMDKTYPLSTGDVRAMFDPAQRDQLRARCEGATFVHLFNEKWRRAGIPNDLGPPAGCFIDDLLRSHGFEAPSPRMEIAQVRRWTASLTLQAAD